MRRKKPSISRRQKNGDGRKEPAAGANPDAKVPYIVAVTGCPTGIAHTYMAAESIEKKAKEMGYRVKVETRGSGGAKIY
ncbi:PTS fructose transporter subunit IIB [Allobaculum sp. Allo2]|uniref:PTS fructose transporter subunit IIB n=1 Tax=Allobaculum sp. Allo2 TaxID=2853432 RepID=UPI001F616777|nr:PTS fructose transporter subunit IIB [Allobaculum sp. Allo2]